MQSRSCGRTLCLLPQEAPLAQATVLEGRKAFQVHGQILTAACPILQPCTELGRSEGATNVPPHSPWGGVFCSRSPPTPDPSFCWWLGPSGDPASSSLQSHK